jgi:arylsulfatase A-like enzyme
MRTVIVNVRGFHTGYLGCYGNQWIRTPALDRLAAEGVVFDQHLADVPDAAGARRGWRTGRHPFPGPEAVAEGLDLVGTLRAASVRTMLIIDNSRPFPQEFSLGWDRVEQASGLEPALELARDRLEELAGEENWLLWIELATLLPPWDVPADFRDPYFHEEAAEEDEEDDEADEEVALAEEEEDPLTPWPDPPTGFINTEDDIDFCRLQSTYAGAVSYADAGVGVLLEELDRLHLAGECLLLVTSDHGQALGEHGICGPHRPWLHDELIHVPLLLRLPGSLAATGGLTPRRSPVLAATGGLTPRRSPVLTQSVDLPPTLLDAFGLPRPPELHGFSLLPLARGEAASVRAYACCGLAIGSAVEWCLRTPDWTFLLPIASHPEDAPRRPQLYVKPDDRWEVNDVIQHHLELAEGFERTLREFMTASRQPGPLQPPPLYEPQPEK